MDDLRPRLEQALAGTHGSEHRGEWAESRKDADPALRPAVNDVRGRIARLSAAKG